MAISVPKHERKTMHVYTHARDVIQQAFVSYTHSMISMFTSLIEKKVMVILELPNQIITHVHARADQSF